MMFIELRRIEYYSGRYNSAPALFALSEISRVITCTDDSSYTNIITKDGKKHTIADQYENVKKKIREALEKT